MAGAGKNVKRYMVAAALAVTSVVSVVGAAPRAEASTYGWVYLSFPSWMGNCPRGDIKWLNVAVGNTWSGSDAGDDMVYARVVLNANQSVEEQGQCYVNGRVVTNSVPVSQTIRPTKNNQTVFIGPRGAYNQ